MAAAGGSKQQQLAMILKSAVLRTKVKHRPAPSLFFMPGLSSKQPIWTKEVMEHSVGAREAVSRLEGSYSVILDEYKNLMSMKQGKNDFAHDKENASEHLHKGNWDWKSYVSKGERNADFAVHCPKTCEVLESFSSPDFMTGTPFSFCFFSTMGAGATIAPHHSPMNLRIRCHFPLIIPPSQGPDGDCGMEVGGEIVRWEQGKALFFDDAFEHRVWNKTNSDRVVLLFDLWHPDLSSDEIAVIKEMFAFAKKEGWYK